MHILGIFHFKKAFWLCFKIEITNLQLVFQMFEVLEAFQNIVCLHYQIVGVYQSLLPIRIIVTTFSFDHGAQSNCS
jgi:hypothetical protein